MLSELYHKEIFKKEQPGKNFYSLAVITYLKAKTAFEEGQESFWPLLCRAQYYLGYATGVAEKGENRKMAHDFGGEARSKQSKEKKKIVANLLNSNRPVGGWESERAAAKSIFDQMKKLNQDRNLKLVESNLVNLMTTWQRDDPDVRKAFLGE